MPPFLHHLHGGFSYLALTISSPLCCVPSRLHPTSHSFVLLRLCSALSRHSATLPSLLTVPTYPYPNPNPNPPPLSSLPHCLPLVFWLIRGLRKILPWQCNGRGSKHTFLLQSFCLCSTHTTSQAWVLHSHQYICSLKLEIRNLNCMLSNGAKMLPW